MNEHEAASVGDGLAGVLALMTEHVRISTAGMAGESRRGFWMCACREWGHDKDGDRTRGHRAHVAAVIDRDWLPSEVARLRAKVERVEALAARWRCNCGGPSPEGHHEMHCDSYYGDVLRAALEDGDR